MVKVHFLFIVFITSGFLLTIQLIALQYLLGKGNVEEPPTWAILDAINSAAIAKNIPLILIDKLVLNFIEAGIYLPTRQECFESKVRANQLLKKNRITLNDRQKNIVYSDYFDFVDSSCRILCSSSSKITHLAILADLVTNERISQLSGYLNEHHGLTTVMLKEYDPALEHLNLHISIPTHIFILDERVDIRKESHVVHIAVLHERIKGQYWWQAPVKINENLERILHRQGLKKFEFRLPYSSAIFKKTQLLRTTIDGLEMFLPMPMKSFEASIEDKRFIECNQLEASKFYNQYPRNESHEASLFRLKATSLLAEVSNLFENELHIPFWLSSGTLLGYYRQCDFIVYSGDVDIGVWADDFKPEIIDVLSTHGLPLIHWFGRPNDSLELSFVKGDLKLDMFFFYRNADHYWNGGTQARTGLKYKYTFPQFSLCWTEFAGLCLRVPCQTEAYIEANYGDGWRKQVETWDWKSSPPNVQPNGQWQAHEWSETIRLIPLPGL